MNKLYQSITQPFRLSLTWCYQGLKLLRENPVSILLVSGACLVLFLLGFFAARFLRSGFTLVLLASVGVSVVFPLTLICLGVVVNSNFTLRQNKAKFMFSQIWETHSVRLIMIYLLLVLLISLSGSYLTIIFPAFNFQIGVIMELLLLILQLVSLLALPTNVATCGRIKPFKLLLSGLHGLFFNFIPCLLFLIVILLGLYIAIAVAKLAAEIIGVWALIIYVIEVWVFITWFGLSAAFMARKIMGTRHHVIE